MSKKFMLLYLAPVAAERQMEVSPEDMKKGMEPWLKWYGKHGDAIVDMGTPLGKGAHFTKGGRSAGRTQVAGYSIVQAESMQTAEAMVSDHPHFMLPGAGIEVLEYLPMPGM